MMLEHRTYRTKKGYDEGDKQGQVWKIDKEAGYRVRVRRIK